MKKDNPIAGIIFLMVFCISSIATAADTQTLVVTEFGKVGIGTATPYKVLSIKAQAKMDGIWIDPPDGSSAVVGLHNDMCQGCVNALVQEGDRMLLWQNDAIDSNSAGGMVIGPWSNSPKGIRIDYRGYVGIGAANPTEKLHVDGNVLANAFNNPSDARWKENIETIDNALDMVSRLRGVSYHWTDPSLGEGRQIGVIAQEVEQVLPEVVHTDSQGYKSVEYSKLAAPLIEAVKVLNEHNQNLEVENTHLEQEVASLKKEISAVRCEFEQRLSKIEATLSGRE